VVGSGDELALNPFGLQVSTDGGPGCSRRHSVCLQRTNREGSAMRYIRRMSVFTVAPLIPVAAAALVLPLLAAAELPQYQTKDIGTLGGTSSTAYAGNDSGWIVGSAETADGYRHAVIYRAGELEDLGTLGGLYSTAVAINSSGQVTGSAENAAGREHAFLYSSGQMIDLGTLGGQSSYGVAINSAGQVVGFADTPDGGYRAFLYSGGQMIDLGTLGGKMSRAEAINDSGQVTGWASSADGSVHAFIYSDGQMQDLGVFGGSYSAGFDINEAGEVTGESTLDNQYQTHAFLFSGGAMIDIGQNPTVEYIANSFGAAISDDGTVAGTFHDFGFAARFGCEERCLPFVYADGARTEPTLRNYGGAVGLSNSGYVTGTLGGFPWYDMRTFVERPGKSMVVLGNPQWMTALFPNFLYGNNAVAVNEAGQIAGNAHTYFGSDFGVERGFLATEVTTLFDRLQTATGVPGPTKKLTKNVTVARAYYDANDLVATCASMTSYNEQVQAISAKKTPQSVKDDLIEQSSEIMNAINCP
jgi:probable HAF family extracellular repeat protein